MLETYEEEDFRYGIITNARFGAVSWKHTGAGTKDTEKINAKHSLMSPSCRRAVRPKALKKSYKSSLVAMNYRFYKGENSIIFYNEIQKIP